MSEPTSPAKAAADAAGLEMSEARGAEVDAEVARIRGGVANVAGAHMGFYDEPVHFLAALEECAEDEA